MQSSGLQIALLPSYLDVHKREAGVLYNWPESVPRPHGFGTRILRDGRRGIKNNRQEAGAPVVCVAAGGAHSGDLYGEEVW